MLNLALSYFFGIISGILLSGIAIFVGKRFEKEINKEFVSGKAEIIKLNEEEYAH